MTELSWGSKWRVEKKDGHWEATAPNGKVQRFKQWKAALVWINFINGLGRVIHERQLARMAETSERGEDRVVDGEVCQVEGEV